MRTIVKVVSVESGLLLRRYEDHSSEILALSISSGGQIAASAETGNRARIWNLNSGQMVQAIDGYSNIGAMIFSRDAGRFILGGYPIDARGLITDEGSVLAIFDLRDSAAPVKLSDRVNAPGEVIFHPDGRRYVSFGGAIRVWASDTGHLDQLFQMPESVSYGAISPDGRWLATVGAKEIYLLEMEPLRIVRKITTVGMRESRIAFSADSQRISSITFVTEDPPATAINTWEIRSGRHLFKLADESKFQFLHRTYESAIVSTSQFAGHLDHPRRYHQRMAACRKRWTEARVRG